MITSSTLPIEGLRESIETCGFAVIDSGMSPYAVDTARAIAEGVNFRRQEDGLHWDVGRVERGYGCLLNDLMPIVKDVKRVHGVYADINPGRLSISRLGGNGEVFEHRDAKTASGFVIVAALDGFRELLISNRENSGMFAKRITKTVSLNPGSVVVLNQEKRAGPARLPHSLRNISPSDPSTSVLLDAIAE